MSLPRDSPGRRRRDCFFRIPRGVNLARRQDAESCCSRHIIEAETKGLRNGKGELNSAPLSRTATIYFIRDNGTGFNMTYADKLFRAFQAFPRLSGLRPPCSPTHFARLTQQQTIWGHPNSFFEGMPPMRLAALRRKADWLNASHFSCRERARPFRSSSSTSKPRS
jgi:hypothetical protein